MSSHEQPRVARRSASHGTLNSSYTNQSSASTESALNEQTPAFKPLRSIREHTTFLDPAASADGMLRKTTETGNIGIFSIHSGRFKGLRTRSSLGDLQPHPPLLVRGKDELNRQDAHRKLSTYRDSTSEIISMYGSEKQSSSKSATGTLSPPWDENGQQRSFSMTTCGSQGYAPLPRNFGPRHAQDFNTQAQRPRSPYPYPTRLPRPGIRPSSPALTENGMVDYSRMVEINRIPQQRTTHHPHATLFPHKTTRDLPPPLSMRSGVNQSTCSLTDAGSPRPYQQRMSRRPPLPNLLHPRSLISRHRLESRSPDQSWRTMSLASTSGGYTSSPLAPPRPPQSEKPPIFYDYSEDFEDVNIELPPDYQIPPTTQRASSAFHSELAEHMLAGCSDRAASENASVNEDNNQDVVDFLRRASRVEELEAEDSSMFNDYRPVSQLDQRASNGNSSYRPTGTSRGSSPVLPELLYTMDESYAPMHAVEDLHQSMTADVVSKNPDASPHGSLIGLVSGDSTTESPFEPGTPAFVELATNRDQYSASPDTNHQKENFSSVPVVDHESACPRIAMTVIPRPDLASVISTTLPDRYSNRGRKDSRLLSLSSGLSDLASFVKHIGSHIEDPQFDNKDEDDDHDEIPYPSSFPSSMSAPGAEQGQHYGHPTPREPAPPRKSSLPQHLRPLAASRTYAGEDDLQRFQVVSTRSGPTLVPQPISPAKLLRVKNSIPQLMKALPPLPDFDLAPDSPFGAAVPFELLEISRLTEARSTLIDDSVLQNQTEKERKDRGTSSLINDVAKPRLKLKNAAPFAAGPSQNFRRRYTQQADATLPDSPWTSPPTRAGCPTAAIKKRLPIKLSRPTLESLTSEDIETGTVKRRHGLSKSSTISDIAAFQPVDLFTSPRGPCMAVHEAEAAHRETSSNDVLHSAPVTGLRNIPVVTIQQVEPSDEQTDDARDTCYGIHVPTLHPAVGETECHEEPPVHSFFSDNSTATPRRGLRKRISDLRSRLGDHHRHQQDSQSAAGQDQLDGNKGILLGSDDDRFKDLLAGVRQVKDCHRGVPSKGTVRRKLGKLVQGAKHKLRTLKKHKRRPE